MEEIWKEIELKGIKFKVSSQGLWRTIKKLIMDLIGWINNYI